MAGRALRDSHLGRAGLPIWALGGGAAVGSDPAEGCTAPGASRFSPSAGLEGEEEPTGDPGPTGPAGGVGSPRRGGRGPPRIPPLGHAAGGRCSGRYSLLHL